MDAKQSFHWHLTALVQRCALWAAALVLSFSLLKLAAKDAGSLGTLRVPKSRRARRRVISQFLGRCSWALRACGRLFTLPPPAEVWRRQITKYRLLKIYSRLRSLPRRRELIISKRARDLQATIVRRHFRRLLNLSISRRDARAISFHVQGSGVVLDFLKFAGLPQVPGSPERLSAALQDYIAHAKVEESRASWWHLTTKWIKSHSRGWSLLAVLHVAWGKRYAEFRGRRLMEQIEGETLRASMAKALRLSQHRQNGLAQTLRHEILLAAFWEIALAAEHPALNSTESLENAWVKVASNHHIRAHPRFLDTPQLISEQQPT